MQALLAEYLTNGDTLEASRCLMELNVPYYHHELVKRALVMAADDSKDHDSPLLLKLLSDLASSGAITQVRCSLIVFVAHDFPLLSVCPYTHALLVFLHCLPAIIFLSVQVMPCQTDRQELFAFFVSPVA